MSEVADTRHWSMLPSSIQVATSYVTQPNLQIVTKFGTETLNISEHTHTVVLLSSLTNKAHTASY